MIKILHCADIHLDSAFASDNAAKSELRRKELRETFMSVINHAKTNKADIVLIAGDLFDSDFVSRETIKTLIDEFSNASECRFIISPGNHDPFSDSSIYNRVVFPENVYIFNQETLTYFLFEELGIAIYGYAFTKPELSHNPFSGCRPENEEIINLLCAHADFAVGSKYCPVTKNDIRSSGFDYIAFGHIHTGNGMMKEGKTYYAYSGCPEGRDFGELGHKGAFWIEIDKNFFDYKFIRFSKRRYESDRLNITGCSAMSEVIEIIGDHITKNGYGGDTILRIFLDGDVDPEFVISKSLLKSSFNNLFDLTIIDNTSPLYDYTYLKDDQTIRGAFFNKLLPLIQYGTQEERDIAVKALHYGLSAISGSDIIDFEL